MAAAYLFHICQNHAVVAGNKRVGANAANTFLLLDDWEPDVEPDELADLPSDSACADQDCEPPIHHLTQI
jgi:prophage maintenance system killer protein